MEAFWHNLVQMYQAADRLTLLQFHSAVAVLLILILLFLRHGRGLRLASRASKRVAELTEGLSELSTALKGLRETLGAELESRLSENVEPRLASLEAGLHSFRATYGNRLEERASELQKKIGQVMAEIKATQAEVKALRQRLSDVQEHVPEMLRKLGEFRKALAQGYESEVSNILEAFDNAVGTVVAQMRDELQKGLGRLQGMEELAREQRPSEEAQREVGSAPDQPPGLALEPEEGPGNEDEETGLPAAWLKEGGDLDPSVDDEEETDGAEDVVREEGYTDEDLSDL